MTNTKTNTNRNRYTNTNTKDWECHIVVFVKSSADPWLSSGLWLHQPPARTLTSIAIRRSSVKKLPIVFIFLREQIAFVFFSCLRTFVGSLLNVLCMCITLYSHCVILCTVFYTSQLVAHNILLQSTFCRKIGHFHV